LLGPSLRLLLSSLSCCCLLIGSEQHWVGRKIAIKLFLSQLRFQGRLWVIILLYDIYDLFQLNINSLALKQVCLSEQLKQLINLQGDVASAIVQVATLLGEVVEDLTQLVGVLFEDFLGQSESLLIFDSLGLVFDCEGCEVGAEGVLQL